MIYTLALALLRAGGAMPPRDEYKKDWFVPLFPLDLECRVRYRLTTERGRIAGFVVQLEWYDGVNWSPVVRYDCAHGQPHRDTLRWDGTVVEKDWLPCDYDQAFDHADRDVRANWRRYRAAFLGRLP